MNKKIKNIGIGLLGLAATFGVANAGVFGYMGLNDDGGFGIYFESNAGSPELVALTSVTIALDGDNIFDVLAGNDGFDPHRAVSEVASSGTTLPTLSGSSASEGGILGTFNFTSFQPGDTINIDFDLDTTTIESGSPLNATVQFNFFDNVAFGTVTYEKTVKLAPSPVSIDGTSYTYTVAIPEPGTLALAAIMLGSFGGLHLLRRRKKA